MIDSLARAAGALGDNKYLTAAQSAASFLLTKLRRADGRLLHSYRNGEAKLAAYLDDYAYLTSALVSLYEADFDGRWIDAAVELADIVMRRFHDADNGGFYFTADDHERLIARNKDFQDSSVPSGNGMAATALVRLGTLCGRSDYLEAARGTLALAAGMMERVPTAAGQLLIAADLLLGPLYELVLIPGSDAEENNQTLAGVRASYQPNRVLASVGKNPSPQLAALLADRPAINNRATLYVCQGFTCQAPLVGKEAILSALAALK
jgi:uncharacterized protein YyaL (SSP411 family)